MSEPIKGKVAAIEDKYNVVINRGSVDGVKPGMVFVIEDPVGKEVKDPDTGDSLGYIPTEKIKVKVFDVQDRFSRAATFVRVKPPSIYQQAAAQLLDEYRIESRKRELFSPHSVWSIPPGDPNAKLRAALDVMQMGSEVGESNDPPTVVKVDVGDVAREVVE